MTRTASRPQTVLLALVIPAIALAATLVTRGVKGPSSDSVVTHPHTIVIKNFAFHPARLTVNKGTRLTVTNADGMTHTFTARNGSLRSVQLASGKSVTIALLEDTLRETTWFPGATKSGFTIWSNVVGPLEL